MGKNRDRRRAMLAKKRARRLAERGEEPRASADGWVEVEVKLDEHGNEVGTCPCCGGVLEFR